VGPFDVLIVTVWEHPELTQPLGQFRNDMAAGQLIDADGTMFFPYVGRMKLSGLTTTEIQTQITQQLSKILKSPQVDIKVSGFRSQRAHVSGQVRNPGSIAIDDIPLTLAELLNKAGGILTSGDASGVKLVRGRKTYELDVDALMQAGAPIDSIRILPGDRLIVPSQDDRVAYVLGEVSRPSVIPLANGRSSLIRALTQTGGFTDMSSDAAGLYVVRAHDSSQVTVFSLDGRSPVALALAGQFQLRPKDLVYVDQSGLSRWYRVTQMLVPTSTIINSSMSSLTNAGVQLDLNAIKDGL
jgi:polysaccharide export outer membrane protein